MGDYRESVNQYLNGQVSTPDIKETERFGAVKYGFGLNTEQEVTDSLRLFARFGWNDDRHESFVYTEVGQTIEFGGDYSGKSWRRSNDKVGVAYVSNAIKRDHQNYLHYGGLGFLLGDGNLRYGREDIWSGITTRTSGEDCLGPSAERRLHIPAITPTAGRFM